MQTWALKIRAMVPEKRSYDYECNDFSSYLSVLLVIQNIQIK
jgi:hypothetical protein